MSALYLMRYGGQTGQGAGALYVGNGSIVGCDVAGGRYKGQYSEDGNRMQGSVTLEMVENGTLVTGQPAPAGTRLTLSFDWPTAFADGTAQTVLVGGQPVSVAFEKVGDITA